jgi:aspartyl-tRNA synthetase
MASGLDRYYQVARCLRDEDLRADRQPEFTQIDAEMSFVGESDVKAVCEEMLAEMWTVAGGPRPETPFPVLTHHEALERYGTDKPDLRIPWEIRDLSEVLTGIGFRIFDGAVDAGGRVRGLRVPGGGDLSRSRLDELDELARDRGAKGVLWLKTEADGWSGAPAAAVEDGADAALRAAADLEEGDLLLLVAGPDEETGPALDVLRRRCAELLGAVGEDGRFAWITDFPLFHRDPKTGALEPSHHPFTMPDDPERMKDIKTENTEKMAELTSDAYDIVLNGFEIGGGSRRIHDPDLQSKVFDILGLSDEEVEERFGWFVDAFQYGAPPHRGIAFGVDRILMVFRDEPNIRVVIPFPKSQQGLEYLTGAPAPPRELGRGTTARFDLPVLV